MNDIEILTHLADVDNEAIEVPVSFILRNARGSVDWGEAWDDGTAWWEIGIKGKASDTGFGHLIDSILSEGWQEGSAIGFDGETITEGHHRLVAAILLGLDTVLVSPWGDDATGNLCAHWNDDNPNPIHLGLFT